MARGEESLASETVNELAELAVRGPDQSCNLIACPQGRAGSSPARLTRDSCHAQAVDPGTAPTVPSLSL
ncbi:predicted protein [Deinococcus grandis]|uniref:Uncharacterized protein n=1 Tax=Deinococcus grandis TaxID=57498 RepID=A0A100HNC5_9DEIO|nr:predicted protein [Deinococcus grandis]